MGQELSQLNELRREIDSIDDALHDLLMRRSDVSRAVARVKQPLAGEDGGSLADAMRPAREAAILRRLLARHRGDLPTQVVVRIWREIIAASLQIQSRFELHVLAGTEFHDLARAYFGSLAPIKIHARPSLVVHACAENPNSIGLLSLPEFEEPGASWWSQLAPSGQPGPRVVAKLPFVVEDAEAPAAFAIGAIEQAPSGDDTTLLLLEIAPGTSRTKLSAFMKKAGLDATLTATGRISDKRVPDEVLLAVKGFVARGDERLQALMEIAGDSVARAVQIGGYANPVITRAPNRSP